MPGASVLGCLRLRCTRRRSPGISAVRSRLRPRSVSIAEGCIIMKVLELQSLRGGQLTRERLQVWAGYLASAVAALMLLISAAMKIAGAPETVAEFSRLGYGADMLPVLATLEIACVALYLIPYTQFLGAVLTTGFLGGAIATHLRIGDPFAIPLGVGLLVWAGLTLRNQHIRDLWVSPPRKHTGAADSFAHETKAA